MQWLLQDVSISELIVRQNFEAVKAIGDKYNNIGFISGTPYITNLDVALSDPEEVLITRGGVKAISLITDATSITELCPVLIDERYLRALKKSIFYDKQSFDQAYYSQFDLPLLNGQSEFMTVADNLDRTFNRPMFIKPSFDLKEFMAGIIEPGMTVREFIETQKHVVDYKKSVLLVAEPQIIEAEYRFFVVGGEVVTGSAYKSGADIKYSSYIPEDILRAADEYKSLYEPHQIFTMDLAKTPKGVKIVEYNCWNGSGLYHSDTALLFRSVRDLTLSNNRVCINYVPY